MNPLLRTTVLFAVAGGLLAAPAVAAQAASALPAGSPGPQFLTSGRQPTGQQPTAPTQQHPPVAALRPLRPVDPAAPAPGATIAPAGPLGAGHKAERLHEAVEFFWYDCYHSAQLEQPLESWAGRHRDDVTLRRVPAIWTGSPDEAAQRAHARLYYTLERLGQVDRLQATVFRSIREQHADLTTENSAVDWASAHGIDAARFRAAYRSAEVDRLVEDAPRVFVANKVTELPTVIVDGAGRTSPTRSGGVDNMPAELDRLVAEQPAG
ncbi:DsbA family protein [Kitasatospora sp. NPDC088134]|uniref:thiol:disulfide interchange protein DsbA/DsbL n=1 Tax=Kitasatospora sp. NPDC088134 TaxID=3364071 RepID=UPI003805C635